MYELAKPFYEIFTAPPQQWHPLLVHFPLVFLISEAFFVSLFLVTKKEYFEIGSYHFLNAAFWFLPIVAIAGFHDCGLSLGPGNKFLLGLQDRWENAFRFQSSVTVHFWLAILLIAITSCRLFWRWRSGLGVWKGARGFFYSFLTFWGIWCLFAMSYCGGLLSHK
jgi:uncharacterized membrane protein